jgi:hypothetical protein
MGTFKSDMLEVLLTLQLWLNYKKPSASLQIHNSTPCFWSSPVQQNEIESL